MYYAVPSVVDNGDTVIYKYTGDDLCTGWYYIHNDELRDLKNRGNTRISVDYIKTRCITEYKDEADLIKEICFLMLRI